MISSTPSKIFGVVCTLILGASTALAGWMTQAVATPDGKVPVDVFGLSMRLDSEGNPHIAFAFQDDLAHAFLQQGRWHVERVDALGDPLAQISIALDAMDHIHITYHTFQSSLGDIRYAHFDGSTWSVERIDQGEGSSIAVDANNLPHISYIRMGGSLRYARYDGSNWILESASTLGMDGRAGTALALTPDGKAYLLAVRFLSPTPGRLVLAKNDGAAWQVDPNGIDDWSGCSSGDHPGISLDSNENPHVVYTQANSTKYAYWNGLSWQIETIAPGFDSSIAVDMHDIPHVSFTTGCTGADLMYARRDPNGSWSSELASSGNHFETSIAVDRLGLPHISTVLIPDFNQGRETLLAYSVLRKPELSMTWAKIDRTSSSGGGQVVKGKVQLFNDGTGAARRFKLSFYLSDDAIHDAGDAQVGRARDLSVIGAGRSAAITFNHVFSATVSGKFIIAVIQPRAPSDEVDVSNDTAAAMIP